MALKLLSSVAVRFFDTVDANYCFLCWRQFLQSKGPTLLPGLLLSRASKDYDLKDIEDVRSRFAIRKIDFCLIVWNKHFRPVRFRRCTCVQRSA